MLSWGNLPKPICWKMPRSAVKPGSVATCVADDHLSGTAIARSLERSTRKSNDASRLVAQPAGKLPLCLILLRAGFTKPLKSPPALVVSYTTVSPLPRSPYSNASAFEAGPFGGLLSVALSLALRLVGVTDRSALRSPDFPLLKIINSDHLANRGLCIVKRSRLGCYLPSRFFLLDRRNLPGETQAVVSDLPSRALTRWPGQLPVA